MTKTTGSYQNKTAKLKEYFDRSIIVLVDNKKILLGLILFILLLSISLSVYPLSIPPPKAIGEFGGNLPPSREHPLGTDTFGRDMVQVLLYGIQLSLYVGFMAGIIGSLIGLVSGSVAGFRGGLIDHIIRSSTDIFLVIPLWPILVLILVSYPGISLFGVSLILAVFSWPWTARTVRSQILSLKERDYVDLAKISGQNQFEILFGEIFPNMIPYISVVFVNAVIGAMFAEVSLEVIGLGAHGANTLGFIFHYAIANSAVLKGYWWWVIPPTIAIIWIFTSLYLITLGLDSIANPRLKKITGR